MKKDKNYTGLVIGDVGSGKTFVAFLTALGYLKNSVNAKVVVIAPTEVLAYQHYLSFVSLKKALNIQDIDDVYLSAKNAFKNELEVKGKARKTIINNENKTIIIGTHSVLNIEGTNFDLVIVDEQHRFGVNQRNNFNKYPHHFLSLTATPIPRSLALSLFSKLDTHFLERLKGRAQIETVINDFDYLMSDNFIDYLNTSYISKGSKIYIVCPKITSKESEEKVYSIEELGEYFESKFPGSVITMTGKDKDKKEKLTQFKSDPSKTILVSTSVIEVGVDVAEARLMVIFNSERFGLAALHQLRGRVGRNNFEDNKCILGVDKKYKFIKRLKTLTESNDGFEIAQKDLELRGSGDLAGAIQSGFSEEIDIIVKSDPTDLQYLQALVKKTNISDSPRLNNYINARLENYHGE
jgi:ATP-dependent DNA helicase RecG